MNIYQKVKSSFYLKCDSCQEVGEVLATDRLEAALEFQKEGWESGFSFDNGYAYCPECKPRYESDHDPHY